MPLPGNICLDGRCRNNFLKQEYQKHMQLCFTVDWEDWYHGLRMPAHEWKGLERRIKIGHHKLLDLLSKYRIKATYFLLGITAEEFPELVEEIKNEGHELGCHTYSHPFLTDITVQEFRSEIQKCKEIISSFQSGYEGFRAPYFSIKKDNLWVLDILKEENFLYDSSIFPGNTFRAGIQGFVKHIHTLPNGLKEFPISNFEVAKFDFGIGGAYFRILPYRYFKYRLKEILQSRPALFYFHPWEFDVKQPYIQGLTHRAVHSHYYNLGATERKLKRLLSDFEFTPLTEILSNKGVAQICLA
jgi:polysaccharide deacetylase family protein (PEP-CTERM system associated)